TVLVVAVLVYGIWRFRAPGDVAVCLLAGVGADAVLRRLLEGDVPAPAATSGLLGRHRALTETSAVAAPAETVPPTDRRVTRRRTPE
ncbi:MAG TPA: hypothetical protein VK507_17930, partial [Iamia sp.]|nr:hypothetical protein [Iamia sp.]